MLGNISRHDYAARARKLPPHSRLSMSDRAIHLYLGLLDEVDRPHVHEACLAMLSEEERARAARFVAERHRRHFVLAHGLVRAALSRQAPPVDPAAWRFIADRHGRPFVAGPRTDKLLHFNLSHTEGCVACVISPSASVGIDVEATDRPCSHLAIAEFTFSSAEVADLRGLPPAELIDRFFDYWTLKEAYIKARGMGLRLPLDQFSIRIQRQRKIGIAFAPEFGDDAGRWRFTQASPSPRLRLAIADGSGSNGGFPIINQPWPVP
jgi:4'-phosphopantetheinyl transferase